MRCRPLSILILDIDFFKAVNDTHGQSAGDEVLKEFSRRLKKAVRGIDLACRYGGEEFVVVMPDTDIAMATAVAERLRRRIAAEPFPINRDARTAKVTISIGIAAMRSSEDKPAEIVAKAAGRPGALSRQARRPQPGRRRRRVMPQRRPSPGSRVTRRPAIPSDNH